MWHHLGRGNRHSAAAPSTGIAAPAWPLDRISARHVNIGGNTSAQAHHLSAAAVSDLTHLGGGERGDAKMGEARKFKAHQ